MNAYVEIRDKKGEDYYYAAVEILDGHLFIKRHLGLYVIEEKELNLSNVHHLRVVRKKDRQSVCFFHNDDQYTFFETSDGFLASNLRTKLYTKAV